MASNLVIPEKDTPEGYESEIDVVNDGLAAAGFYPQNSYTENQDTGIETDGSHNLVLKDPFAGSQKLKDLVTQTAHESLRQLIHLADGVGGPMEGFVSGAFRETLPAGSPFPTTIIWWTDNTKTVKILQKTITFTGVLPTQISWSVYDATGTVVLATVTDAVTYSGPFELSRTRTVT